jgi:hypothetical protein
MTANYENWTLGHIRQTNPIQTQFMVSLPPRGLPLRGNVEPLVLRSPRRSRTKAKTDPTYPAASGVAGLKRYLAKIGHHELKYVDEFGRFPLNPMKESLSKVKIEKKNEKIMG